MIKKTPQEEWEEDRDFSILDGNPYYVDGPTYKLQYDMADVILFGLTPPLETEVERFSFVVELAKFIRENGYAGNEERVDELLRLLDAHHIELFNQQKHGGCSSTG